jgi:hypothetical protein
VNDEQGTRNNEGRSRKMFNAQFSIFKEESNKE